MRPTKNQIYRLWLIGCLSITPGALKAQQAAFTYTALPATFCAPATFTFQHTSTGSPLAVVWDFGNGRTSREQRPVVTFTEAGPVSVTLTAYYSAGNSSTTQSFTIYGEPAADFSVNKQAACGPYTAIFTDLTPGAQQRTWDFGDGTAPVTTSQATIQHQFTRIDTFDVKLTVTNTNGCTKTVVKKEFITIAAPVITVANTGTEGCAPFQASLSAQAATINNDPVATWAWVFGDGQNGSTPNPAIQHTYAAAGTYNVSLTVTTQQGCTAVKNFPQLVRAGNAPQNVSFTATRPNDCAGTSTRLLATAANATRYRWDFGDGTRYEGPENDVNHIFRAAGSVTVQMSAGANGCYTPATPVTLAAAGPVADFTFSRHCDNKKAYTFTNTSAGAPGDTYEWYFDDNSPVDNNLHPVHVFTQPGTYNVRLVARNAAQTCMSTTFRTVQVFSADFHTGVGTICRNSEVAYGVVHVPHTLVDYYSWRFGDGTVLNTTDVDIRKKMAVKGVFSDMLVIFYKDPAYCSDTVVKLQHLNVIAPEAAFTVVAPACEGQPVKFADASAPSPNIPLTNWTWDFGNGATAASQNPPATQFKNSGNYPVKLVIKDARNCMDSITLPVPVHATPIVHALSPQAKLCEGAGVTLQGISNAPVLWQPAYQLSCTGCPNPVATPLKDTSYIAVATTLNGCTASDTVSLKVVPAVTLAVSADTAICRGMSAQLRADGAAFYSWSPATAITGANTSRPVVAPEQNLRYTVTAGNDPACPSATAQINITVKPVPSVNAGPDQTITTGNVLYLRGSHSADVTMKEWKPGTYLDCPGCLETVAAVRESMDYALEVTNTAGCKASDVMHVQLVCDQSRVFLPGGFSPNGDGENEIFYPRGKGVRQVLSLRIFNRLGQEVFRREHFNIDDVSQGWNGSLNGRDLGTDVYVWLLEALCDTGERFRLRGNVTLLR